MELPSAPDPAASEATKSPLRDPRRILILIVHGAIAMALAAFAVERAIRGQPRLGAVSFVAFLFATYELYDRLERFAFSGK